MSEPLFSPSWHRVAGLKPRLRAHVRLHRQTFRGGVWHIVQDSQTGRFHRLSVPAHHIVCLMDGRRTVDEIWKAAADRFGAEQPTQEDIVRLLAMLHGADLIAGDIPPHMDELASRAEKTARRDLLGRIKNPLALRFTLFDPDRFLSFVAPLFRPLFTVWGFIAWAVLVMAGGIVAAINWQAMTGAALENAVTAENVVLMLLIFPIIKAIHELGHASAAKAWGGEVHECGVMMLVLMPVPYVDASSSSAFGEKWRRAVVGGAGIMVELALAAVAVFVWVLAEPGLVRAVAFNVALLGSVSTLLFNGNPLLRFDGYYVLCDLVEIPNLAQRANKYVFHLIQRFGFGVSGLETPVTGRGEAGWFVVYGVAAFFYRMVVTLGIALFIATQFFFVGVALAILSIASTLVWPVLKGIRYLLVDPRLAARRKRAIGLSALGAGAIAAVLLAIPVPYATMADGVVWAGDDEATVRVRSEGVVTEVASEGVKIVETGAVLARLDDPILAARAVLAERQLEELQVRLDSVSISDRVAASILREQIAQSEGQLADMRRSLAELVVVSPRSGRFQPVEAQDLPGRFQRKGDVIGYVTAFDGLIVRSIVPQTDIDLVRRNTIATQVRLPIDAGRTLEASIARHVPAAVSELPHGALSTRGGGHFVIDPRRPEKLQPLESVFQVDVRAQDLPAAARLGMRAHVRFEHPPEAIGWRYFRTIRQVFLRQFNV
jgi:putative peptide zinc metalloprotease protein